MIAYVRLPVLAAWINVSKPIGPTTLAAALASKGQFEEAIQTESEAVDLAPEEARIAYLARLKLYQDRVPFRTEPVGDVSQVLYESSDQ